MLVVHLLENPHVILCSLAVNVTRNLSIKTADLIKGQPIDVLAAQQERKAEPENTCYPGQI